MQPQQDQRTEAALYWSAISLIICERLSISEAAQRLGVDVVKLRCLLRQRRRLLAATLAARFPQDGCH